MVNISILSHFPLILGTFMNQAEILTVKALEFLTYTPEDSQLQFLRTLAGFIARREPDGIFILNGYAGTGKTSLLAAMIRALKAEKIKTVVMAPTGKAAKVTEKFSGQKALTIHKKIYRPTSMDPGSSAFILDRNRDSDTVFIVDEASMIPDGDASHSVLHHLCRYVYSSPGCVLVFSGDMAQLPPVGQEESFAMNPDRLASLGLRATLFNLVKPMRQADSSGILHNATIIRNMLARFSMESPSPLPLPKFRLRPFADIVTVGGRDLADSISDSWSAVGRDETILITRSNYRANGYNSAIRSQVLYADGVIERGEKIVISKNDYYWSAVNKIEGFIANGETATVEWVGKREKAYGRWFIDVELRFSGIEQPVGAKIMLRSLNSEGPAIPRDEATRFYATVMDSKEGELSQKIKATLEDPFYNALQVKYAYCVTCHKAQGGQWKHVYIDLGGIAPENINSDFYRWLYTAVTRATEKLFLINYVTEDY